MLVNDMEALKPTNFPYALPEKYGRIILTQEVAPGVYYVSAVQHEEHPRIAREYLVVREDVEFISAEAKQYGVRVGKEPVLLTYDMEEPTSGFQIIKYEIMRYKLLHGLRCEEDIYGVALYAMDTYPEYFGRIPAPTNTPWGRMTRYRETETGVFWIETEQMKECIAVYYPIWDSECPEEKKEKAVFNWYEGSCSVSGYAFYEAKPEKECSKQDL